MEKKNEYQSQMTRNNAKIRSFFHSKGEKKGTKDKGNETKMKIFNFRSDFLSKSQCTSLLFGQEEVIQKSYICQYCNQNKDEKICKYCYMTCHSKCKSNESTSSNRNIEKTESFSCSCGLKMKHQTEMRKKKEIIPCNMLILDQVLRAKGSWCSTHSIQVCCICLVTCHKECNVMTEDQNTAGECNCKSDFHTNYNELALTFPLEEYKEKTGVTVWTIQILNILFSTKSVFKKMSELFIETINNIEKPIDQSFFFLLDLFANTLNRKFKTFYFDEELTRMFNYDYLLQFMYRLPMDNDKMLLVRFRLLFILLFLHLKKDYQEFKSLTSIDFLTLPILERLKYKKRLYRPNSTNEHLMTKTNLKLNEKLKEIALDDVCKIMEISLDYLSIEENQDEFEIGLKFFCFLLKRMAFTNKELDILIKSLFSFYSKFFDYLNGEHSNIYSLLSIFNTISEIYFLIAINYNDNVVEDYLDGRTKSIEGYIHHKSESGSMLFKMVLKSCDILKRHYSFLQKKDSNLKSLEERRREEIINQHLLAVQTQIENKTTGVKLALPSNGGLIVDKIITVFNETLKLFSLADNYYFQLINAMTKEGLADYSSFNVKISKKTFGNFFFNMRENKKNNSSPMTEIKQSIEKHLFTLFTGSYTDSNLRLNISIYSELLEFIQKINQIFERLSSSNKSKSHQKASKGRETKDDQEKEDFRAKIIEANGEVFPFVQSQVFICYLEEFIDSLILNSLDETLTKIIVFFSHKDYPHLLSLNLLEVVFSFLSLYMLTDNGMKYIMSGKNLTRTSKIFRRYSIRLDNKTIIPKFDRDFKLCMTYSGKTLSFLVTLAKAMKVYGIEIKKHKVLMRFKKNILEHLEQITKLREYPGGLGLQVKQHLVQAMKIFHLFSSNYDIEAYEEIKISLISIFCNSAMHLNRKNYFVGLYEEAHTKIRSADSFDSMRNSHFTSENNELLIDPLKPNVINKNSKLHFQEKRHASNQNDNENSQESEQNDKDMTSKQLIQTERQLYLFLFRIITTHTFYVFIDSIEEAIYKEVFSFNSVKLFSNVFRSSELSMEDRAALLAYLRTFVFIEHLDKVNLIKKSEILTNENYKEMIYNNLIKVEGLKYSEPKNNKKLTKEQMLNLGASYELVEEIEQIIDIFIQEIKAFPLQKITEPIRFKEYAQELVFGSKFIADFFYVSKNIVNKLTLQFFHLTRAIIEKSKVFIELLSQLEGGVSDVLENSINRPEVYTEITLQSFNVYDKNRLYKLISEEIEIIFSKTGINQSASLSNYLDVFDNMSEADFTPLSLIETYDYEYFYEQEEGESRPTSEMEVKLSRIKEKYIKQFINITNTNFYSVISTISNESIRTNYRRKIVDYFHSFLLSTEGGILDKLSTLLCIIDKMLFYDGEKMQPMFDMMKYDKFFFPSINNLLHQSIILTVASSKNVYRFPLSIQYISITKLTIQFLQLLGEGFNVDYHDNVFKLQQNLTQARQDEGDENGQEDNEDEEDEKEQKGEKSQVALPQPGDWNEAVPNTFQYLNETIYDSVIINLKRSFYLMDINQRINIEMPYDKLLVLTTNFIDFLIEYIDSKPDSKEFIEKALTLLFFGVKQKGSDALTLTKSERKGVLNEVLFAKIITMKNDQGDYLLRRKVISYVKMKYLQLLITYLQTENKEEMIIGLIKHRCTPVALFSEILFNFKQMIGLLEKLRPSLYRKLMKKQSRESFINLLIEIYVFDNIFILLIEFPLCMKLYILIKTFEEIYHQKALKNHFSKLFTLFDGAKNERTSTLLDYTDLSSEFAKRIYLFLEKIVVKVEIRLSEGNNSKENKANHKKCKAVSNLLYKDLFLDEESKEERKTTRTEGAQASKSSSKSSSSESDSSSSDHEEEEPQASKRTFFVRPYLTFRLSKQSMISFEESVDRTNATSKFIDLINFSDYCIFEMIINAHLIGKSHFKQSCSNLPYRYAEIVNYLFIVAHNVLLIVHFYRSPQMDPSFYDVIDKDRLTAFFFDNYVLGIIQLVFLGWIICNWLYFKFLLSYQHNIMRRFHKNFVFRKKGENQGDNITNALVRYFRDMSKSTIRQIWAKNKGIGYVSSFLVGFFDTLLFNREICIYLYTLVFVSLYLRFKNGLYLVFPTLFIANINRTLFGIFQAMKIKCVNMITVLLFIGLIVYLYMWITFFYMSFLFDFSDIMEWESNMRIKESFCKSSLQCFLFIMSHGVRVGGGIGGLLPKMSFMTDPYFFLKRFLYDMCFFIFIVMILFNVFMGIIVDAFADLRDTNYQRDNDITNVCFICQLTKDDCLTKNINYLTHVTKEHDKWNYVYFLVYLHINNPNDFSGIENYVWEKLEENDFGWLPINDNAE